MAWGRSDEVGSKFSTFFGRLLVLALMVLPSCSFMYPSKPYLPNKSGIEAGETITVGGNENIYTIAHEHNVSMRDLIVLNNLSRHLTLGLGNPWSFLQAVPVLPAISKRRSRHLWTS